MRTRDRAGKPYIGAPMEGAVAHRYAALRGHQKDAFREQAAELTAGLPAGAAVLEVAPGPGYLAIEMARAGSRVTGLDVSATFVEIATEQARRSGVRATFHRGDVADMPFADQTFDLVVCQAAFKNFSRPARALAEAHRVLKAGGRAIVQDMSGLASRADIAAEVNGMALSRLSALMTRTILTWLRHRAYTPADFQRLAAHSPFGTCEIVTYGITVEVRLTK